MRSLSLPSAIVRICRLRGCVLYIKKNTFTEVVTAKIILIISIVFALFVRRSRNQAKWISWIQLPPCGPTFPFNSWGDRGDRDRRIMAVRYNKTGHGYWCLWGDEGCWSQWGGLSTSPKDRDLYIWIDPTPSFSHTPLKAPH